MSELSPLPSVRPSTSYRWDLDVLRIMAILGVVAIHVFGLILGNKELQGTATWYFGVILDIGSIWCVPIFVMISGSLLLGPRTHAAGPGPFLRRRVLRLLPALVVWHLVYLFGVRWLLLGGRLEPAAVFVNFVDARVYTALYFLWLILGLYCVAPVLAAFLAGGGATRARVTAVAACAWTATVIAVPGVTALLGIPRPRSDGALTMWISYVGLFVAGYAWREASSRSRRWIWTGTLAVLLLAAQIWQYTARPDPRLLQALSPVSYLGALMMICSICLFVCVVDLCARRSPSSQLQFALRALGEATFGVFLVHLLVIAVIRVTLPDFYADPAPVAKTLMYVVVIAVSFLISLVARRTPVLRRIF